MVDGSIDYLSDEKAPPIRTARARAAQAGAAGTALAAGEWSVWSAVEMQE